MPNEMLTLYWWLSVVVVGIVINLASAYLKPTVDFILGSVWSGWRSRIKLSNDRLRKEAEMLLPETQLLMIMGFQQMQAESRFILRCY